uniref:Uncharacterized protein n=1 Tax=Cacopsylla melanoneura TaxID=428564 RepID=A0A8D8TE55_9HEMI
MNGQTLAEQDNIYSDVYQLYCTVYAENRRLRKEMDAHRRSLGEGGSSARGSSSESSSSVSRNRLDGDGDVAARVAGPVAKIEKLYRRTKKENYRMLKILNKK